ncbi:carbohydrate kinase [Citrobacter koseri]|uniref:Carbohydrate kinase n=1 Tax=Citrobacter koseri TaxID=545 RepID=A0A2X2VL37_CITKO|nr:carbohydrate kinase [Citrobacter koseri]
MYENAWQFFDLADFLTWRATGDLARSICTVTCKWTWLAHENRWDPDYFRTIGLAELADDEFARIGQRIVPPGTPCGDGLTEQAAQEMGLPAGTPVAVGLIDAHAGGIGTVGVEGGALNNNGICVWHLILHHDFNERSRFRSRRLGAVLQRDGARALAC